MSMCHNIYITQSQDDKLLNTWHVNLFRFVFADMFWHKSNTFSFLSVKKTKTCILTISLDFDASSWCGGKKTNFQLESRWPQAGERVHRQHRVTVGCADGRLRPTLPLPLAHPQATVPPQRHVSRLENTCKSIEHCNLVTLLVPGEPRIFQGVTWCKTFESNVIACSIGTKCWCVPWSRRRCCSPCPTPNTWSCPWTMTRTWTWWRPLTGGASTSTPAMPKERSASGDGRTCACVSLASIESDRWLLIQEMLAWCRFWCWTQTLRTWWRRSESPLAPATPQPSNPSNLHARAGETTAKHVLFGLVLFKPLWFVFCLLIKINGFTCQK